MCRNNERRVSLCLKMNNNILFVNQRKYTLNSHANIYIHPCINCLTVTHLKSSILNLFTLKYRFLQFKHGRAPSHLVLRERHLSQEAQSCTPPLVLLLLFVLLLVVPEVVAPLLLLLLVLLMGGNVGGCELFILCLYA